MTDLMVHNRSGTHSMDQDMMECATEVQRLNPNLGGGDYQQQQIDGEQDENIEQQQHKDLFKYVQLKTRNNAVGSIMID